MTFQEYQDFTAKSAFYLEHKGREYTAIALAGETGEYCDKIKKNMRDGTPNSMPFSLEDMAKELGDILWYVTRAAYENGYTLEQVAQLNVTKLTSRIERKALSGSGDNR